MNSLGNVTFRQYMDAPKECAVIPVISRGESATVDLYALLTRQILTVPEPTKAQGEITTGYEYADGLKKANIAATISNNHRNSSLWDDVRKAASFVTMNDSAVMRLARTAVAGIDLKFLCTGSCDHGEDGPLSWTSRQTASNLPMDIPAM